jgi:hypothetical protein
VEEVVALCVVVLEAQAEAKTATAANARSVNRVFITRLYRA